MPSFRSLLRFCLARTHFLVVVLFALILFANLAVSYTRTDTQSRVYAAAATQLNFQGRLLTNSGQLVADGYYNVEFKLYNQESGGSDIWTETRTGVDRVRVVNGYFSVYLGEVTAFPGSVNWDQEHWITMNVGGSGGSPVWDGEMTPRLKLTAVPYAFQAAQAAKLNKLDGANTGILDFLSLTANRTINLPDASGTVLLNTTGFSNGGNSFGGVATIGTGDNNGLTIITNGSEAMRIDTGGNVSIGTGSNANEKLQVNGGINIGNTSSSNAGTIRWTGTDFEGYDGVEWKSLTFNGTLSVNPTANKVKQVAESVNGSNAFQNDDELFFSIGANETWSYRFVIHANSAATPDLKFTVTAPGGATCTFGALDAEGAVTSSNLACGATSGVMAGNGVYDVYEVVGTVTNGATPGNITLQWAQNTATAGNSTVAAGSYLNATRISGPSQTAQAFIQNGNSFGTDAILGTNDGQALRLLTNGTERLNITAAGLLNVLNGATIANGLNISSGSFDIGGTTVITSGRALQNVTADTGILTSGQLSTARGGTGLDTSAATNGQLLIGNGTGLSLGTISNNGGITVSNGAGTIGLAVNYGSSANTAVQGNTTLTCSAGSGDLTGGGDTITLGTGGTCSTIAISEAPVFDTSVTTPLLTSSGALTLNTAATAGADDLVLQTAGTEKLRLLENGDLRFEKGTNDVTFAVDTPGAAATYTFTGATGTVLTSVNFASLGLDTAYVNAGEAPVAGDISGSFSGGLTINTNSVALGADTVGDYIASIGTVTGISVTNNSGEGSTPGLAVIYGSSANTSVQGNTTIVCPSGSGNLSGGGNTITLGTGGTCSALSTNNAVSFTTSVTTPLITTAGGLTLRTTATAGADDIIFEVAGTERLRLLENGQLVFGTGANSANLYLSANDTLRTDDLFVAGSGLIVSTGGANITGGLTLSGGAVSINDNSNFAVGINTGSSTGAVTIGGGSVAFTLDSTALDISSSGTLSGVTGYTQASGNFSQSGTGSFSTASGAVNLNGVTTISTSTNAATALTINGTTGTAATALSVVQTGNAANLSLTNSARTSGALIQMTHNTSAFTGTGLLFNFASGSGSFASGNFADFQLNGTSRFTVDNTGALTISTSSNSALRINNTGGLSLFNIDAGSNVVSVGSSTADANTILFVLDSKNSVGDPTGQNGASYYNAADNKARCYENSVWIDCATMALLGETTLGSANGTISVNLAYAAESIECRVEIKGRSVAGTPFLRFNNNTGGTSYGWNQYGMTGVTVTDSQDSSDSEIQLSGTATANIPFSATMKITNFSDTRKGVDWSGIGLDAIGTDSNRYSGVGVFNLTTGSITSVQVVASAGTFNAGSHMWCQGRNVR